MRRLNDRARSDAAPWRAATVTPPWTPGGATRAASSPCCPRRRRGVLRGRWAVALVLSLAAVPVQAGAFDLRAALQAAAPGATVRVPAGVYPGPFVIDKPLQVIAEPGATLDGAGNGDIVQIRAADVTLQGFVIQSTGTDLDRENAGVTVLAPRAVVRDNVLRDVLFGIYLRSAPASRIIGNTVAGKDLDAGRRGDGIRLWYSSGCLVEGNRVQDSRDSVIWFSDDVVVRRNTVLRGRYGLHFMYSHKGLLEDNHLEDNSVGTYLMYSRGTVLRRNTMVGNRGPSGYGLGVKDVDDLLLEDNQLVGNRVGLYVDNSPQRIDAHNRIHRNAIAYNDIGIAFLPDVQRNLLSENAFLENLEQVAILGSGELRGNDFTAGGRGNSWSDYAGYDADADGVGDLPYRSQSLFENLVDRQPKMRLFLYSPVQQAIELAARAFPSVRPRPKLIDTAPLMRPVPLHVPPLRPVPGGPMAATAILLLAAAGLVVTAGCLSPRPGVSMGRPAQRAAGPAVPAPVRRARRRRLSVLDSLRPSQRPSPGAAAFRPCAPEPRQEPPMISVSGLTKRFGPFEAVRDVSFSVQPGQAVALWGPNGAGKTTAIRCILGLLRYQGTIRVCGHDVRRQGRRARASLGYVPQELRFYDDWRTAEFLRFCADLKRAPRDRIPRVLAEVGLDDHASKRVGALSGGMKQRLALAAALLAAPPLLVLDEITSNLDRSARDGFLALLAAQRRQGRTILFTSHRLDELERLADRVLVLEAGRLVGECSPHELAGRIGPQAHLKILVAPADIEPAVRALRHGGFPARANGVGVEVSARYGAKATPIRTLLAAGIAVDDFELQDDPLPGPSGTDGEQTP